MNRKMFLMFLATAVIASQNVNADFLITMAERDNGLSYSFGTGTLDLTGLENVGQQSGGDGFFSDQILIGGGAIFELEFYRGVTVSMTDGWTVAAVGNGNFEWTMISGSSSLIGSPNLLGSGPALFLSGAPGNNSMLEIGATTGFIEGVDFENAGLTANESITFSWSGDSITFVKIPEPGATFFLIAMGFCLMHRASRSNPKYESGATGGRIIGG